MRNAERGVAQVAGERMERSIAAHERACCVLIDAEQRKIAPDNHVIATLCDSVRMGREYARHMREGVRGVADAMAQQSPEEMAAMRVREFTLGWLKDHRGGSPVVLEGGSHLQLLIEDLLAVSETW